MIVYGVAIEQSWIDAGRRRMDGRFESSNIVAAMEKAGMSARAFTTHPKSYWFGQEVANRLLQKERKAGRIKHIGGGVWESTP